MKKNTSGILLILAGVVFPLILLPFVTGYVPDGGISKNIYTLKIWKIPYRFFVAAGVIIIFLGVRRLDIYRRSSKDESSPSTM